MVSRGEKLNQSLFDRRLQEAINRLVEMGLLGKDSYKKLDEIENPTQEVIPPEWGPVTP